MNPTNDDWIDLSALINSSYRPNGEYAIYYEWSETENEIKQSSIFTHLLRKALRKVGHSITRVENLYKNDTYKCVMTTFYTTITEEEGDKMSKLWNEWVRETHDE